MVKPRPLYKKNSLLLAEMARQGYSIQSLAAAIGVHYLTVWRIVNQQHRPNVKNAKAICDLLNATPHKLDLEPWGGGDGDGDGDGGGSTDSERTRSE